MPSPALPLIRATAANAIKAVTASSPNSRIPKPLKFDQNRHLLSRFAFGPWGSDNPGTPDTWFEKQVVLGQKSAGYAGIAGLTDLYPYLLRPPAQTRAQLTAEGNLYGGTSQDQVLRATLALQAWSPAQLYETVVDFFSNRLNVANYSDGVWANRASYDRDVIRANAFGTYRAMLTAAMKHPAMLMYLNGDVSTWVAPNENLGRELLELHTVGITAGYTQTDVVDSARILTGRGVDGRFSDYQWSNGAHSPGPVQVLGFTHANASTATGEEMGDAYVAYLATHPATATSLARALCVRFVSDTPSAELVQAVADTYLANDTAIVPMLRTILRSTEFWDSRGRKLRRPMENVIATVRQLKLTAVDLDKGATALANLGSGLGNRPLQAAAPPGYADTQQSWLSAGALLRLWNAQLNLLNGAWPDSITKPTPDFLYGGPAPATVSVALDALAKTLIGTAMTTNEQNALLEYLGESPGLSLTRSKLPSILPHVAAQLLHTAHHHLR
ncbi:DUF1800 domain-containing protein [Jatrophihabitans sp. YIM 134969]